MAARGSLRMAAHHFQNQTRTGSSLSSPQDIPRARNHLLRVHVWVVATLIPLLVKLTPLRKLLGLLTPRRSARVYRRVPIEQIALLVRNRLSKVIHMRRRACLREGIVLFHFLRLAGHDAVIRFAVYPPSDDEGPMHAHCWVTVGERDISAPPDGPYRTIMVHGEADQSART